MFQCLRDRWQTCVWYLALLFGMIYYIYTIYYAFLRFSPNSWNERPAQQLTSIKWRDDPELDKIHSFVSNGNLPSDVTVITAYFNIGSFKKASYSGKRGKTLYTRWMSVFGRLNNPLVVFTDSDETVSIFEKLRKKFGINQTKIIKISKYDLWAFKLAPLIKTIYEKPNYPVFEPNTVNENYSCVMHAKFELMNKVIKERLFRTKYLCWLDIGLFRAVVEETHIFPIKLPFGFDENKIAYSGVHEFNPALTASNVISRNLDWVSGAIFIGRPEVLYMYTQDYMKAVKKLISMELMSTDQQVIYIMYLPSFNFKPRVEIQTYTTHSDDDWFYLGYLIKDMWDRKKRAHTPLVRFFLATL